MPARRMAVRHWASTQELGMPASERRSRAHRSRFVPGCATTRWLTCWLLALAGCLNPVPDTDPSANPNLGVDLPATEAPSKGSADDPGNGSGFNEQTREPDEPASPAINPPGSGVNLPDAGAPPPLDAGADARSSDQQSEAEQ
jgi:hypothetical protein